MSYVQSVINYLTEGKKPNKDMYKKDVGDMGLVLLEASSLYTNPNNLSAQKLAMQRDYSKSWVDFIEDLLINIRVR